MEPTGVLAAIACLSLAMGVVVWVLPWCWRFLLARVRELSGAIRKDDE